MSSSPTRRLCHGATSRGKPTAKPTSDGFPPYSTNSRGNKSNIDWKISTDPGQGEAAGADLTKNDLDGEVTNLNVLLIVSSEQ